MYSNALIIETDYGETRCWFSMGLTLTELRTALKRCGYDALGISSSKGQARTWQDGSFREVFDLENNLKTFHCWHFQVTSTLKDVPPIRCPYMESLIELMNEQGRDIVCQLNA